MKQCELCGKTEEEILLAEYSAGGEKVYYCPDCEQTILVSKHDPVRMVG